MRALLRSYSPVKGFAYGWFGEASSNVHSLLKIAAGKIATDNWMEMGAPGRRERRPHLYREWGIGNARGRAHELLALHRDAFGGDGSGVFAAQSRRCGPGAPKHLHLAPGQPPQRNGRSA